MEREYLDYLKTIDTSEFAFNVANRLRGKEMSGSLHSKGIAIAYVLYQASLDKNVSINSQEAFEKSCLMPENIRTIIGRNLLDIWSDIAELKDNYASEELLAYIFFNNDLEDSKTEDCSTPLGLLKLVCSILNIQEDENVLELCSGKGNFFVWCSVKKKYKLNVNFFQNIIL